MRWPILFALFLLTSCMTLTMRISHDELQADLAKHFPRDVTRHLVHIRASDPRIEFPGQPDTLGIRLRIEATSDSGSSRLHGTARVEGRIEYVESEHAFYLRDPVVTELVLDPAAGPGVLARAMTHMTGTIGGELVEHATRGAVEELLRRHPIYRLDAQRSEREAKAISHLRSVHVDHQDLVLEVGL